MMELDAIRQALNQRKSRILDLAQAALPQSQFDAFRKLILNELGRQGFEADVLRILAGKCVVGMVRTGQADTCKKGGAP